MSLTEEETNASSLKTNEQELQNVIPHVANLSLQSSVSDDITTTCTTTRDNPPIVKPLCNITEMGIEPVATAATDGVQPILKEPESHATLVNEYACQGLEQLEEKLPILQQPGDTVITDTKEPLSPTVASAEEAFSTLVETKSEISGITDVAPENARGSVGTTKSTAMESTARRKGASKRAVRPRRSNSCLDHFLPVIGGEIAQFTFSMEGVSTAYVERQGGPENHCTCQENRSYTICQHFLKKLKHKAQRIQEVLFHLQITIDLVEYSKRPVGRKLPNIQDQLNMMWLKWTFEELDVSERESLSAPIPMESRVLVVSRYIIQHLQAECLWLHSNIQGLPRNVQDPARELQDIVNYVQIFFYPATSFQNIPGEFLEHSKLTLLKARLLLHDILDYVVEKMTLLRLPGPPASSGRVAEGTKVTEEKNRPFSLESK